MHVFHMLAGLTLLTVHKFHDELSLMFDAIINIYFCHHAG